MGLEKKLLTNWSVYKNQIRAKEENHTYMQMKTRWLHLGVCCNEIHQALQNKLVVLTTLYSLLLLQTSWRDNGYERFTVVSETNCI